MRTYIDEDLAAGLLIRLLQKAAHDVQVPAGVGMLGRSDPAQFTFAIHESRVCLTANYDDYEELHFLVREAQGSHPDILACVKTTTPRVICRRRALGPPFVSWRRLVCRWRMNTSS